jgi:formylglycine-generating enzyme required for sulfatase activity
VAQFAGGVMVQRGARAGLQRAAAGQAAMHVSRHEAQAWCRWAGRRLPTEPEWEVAANTAGTRGFVWGDVFEWVAGSARSYSGAGVAPDFCVDQPPPAGSQGVLRGASFATRLRRHHPKARRFMAPGHDLAFCGFRSCAF